MPLTATGLDLHLVHHTPDLLRRPPASGPGGASLMHLQARDLPGDSSIRRVVRLLGAREEREVHAPDPEHLTTEPQPTQCWGRGSRHPSRGLAQTNRGVDVSLADSLCRIVREFDLEQQRSVVPGRALVSAPRHSTVDPQTRVSAESSSSATHCVCPLPVTPQQSPG